MLAPTAHAQSSATPARIIVGFSPGGTLDVVTRALAEHLREPLGRPVTVENRPGAGGRIGIAALLAAPADGDVAMLCPDAFQSMYPSVFKALNYDPQRDVHPVSIVVTFPMAFAVPASSPVKTFAEFAPWVSAHPDKANFGHAADGGPTHILGLQIARMTGTPLEDIAYPGAAPMISSLIGEHLGAGVSTVGDFAQYHQAGKLRVLAVSAEQRSPLLPDVPTFTELGQRDLAAAGLLAICLSPQASEATVSQWSTAIQQAANDEAFIRRMHALGFTTAPGTPAQAQQAFAAARHFWASAIQASGFQAR